MSNEFGGKLKRFIDDYRLRMNLACMIFGLCASGGRQISPIWLYPIAAWLVGVVAIVVFYVVCLPFISGKPSKVEDWDRFDEFARAVAAGAVLTRLVEVLWD